MKVEVDIIDADKMHVVFDRWYDTPVVPRKGDTWRSRVTDDLYDIVEVEWRAVGDTGLGVAVFVRKRAR